MLFTPAAELRSTRTLSQGARVEIAYGSLNSDPTGTQAHKPGTGFCW
jgi:hypothetical protein